MSFRKSPDLSGRLRNLNSTKDSSLLLAVLNDKQYFSVVTKFNLLIAGGQK